MEAFQSSFSLLTRHDQIFCCQNRCKKGPAPRIFTNKEDLQAALKAYVASPVGLSPNDWDVSRVTDMSYLFDYTCESGDFGWCNGEGQFNEDIGAWDTSAVTDMKFMFANASAFDKPIGDWDTSALIDMDQMFAYTSTFNQPVGVWNTSAVDTMALTFYRATSFNQSLCAWKTDAVDTFGMFDESGCPFTNPSTFAMCQACTLQKW